MLRADTTGGGAYYAAWVSPGGGVTVDYRDTNGLLDKVVANLSATTPAWLEVARSGDTFTAYTSSNGTTWTPVIGSSEVLPNLGGTILVGLAVSSDDVASGGRSAATFQDRGHRRQRAGAPDLYFARPAGPATTSASRRRRATSPCRPARGRCRAGEATSPASWTPSASSPKAKRTDGTVSAEVVSPVRYRPVRQVGRHGPGVDLRHLGLLRRVRHTGQRHPGPVPHARSGRHDEHECQWQRPHLSGDQPIGGHLHRLRLQ